MGNRRDILLSIGAVLGIAPLWIGPVNRRHGEILGSGAGRIGETVADHPASAALRCTPGTLSPQQMEGPFYSPRTPHRRDIRDFGAPADPLLVTGRVLDAQCRPIAGAVLDFWQTGHDGNYDQHGYRYRGHQYTDSAGRFRLVTVPPQAYTAMSAFRAPHIHVKVQGPSTALLTTQLYLPDAEENARDLMYDASLAVAYVPSELAARHATFDFVLASA